LNGRTRRQEQATHSTTLSCCFRIREYFLRTCVEKCVRTGCAGHAHGMCRACARDVQGMRTGCAGHVQGMAGHVHGMCRACAGDGRACARDVQGMCRACTGHVLCCVCELERVTALARVHDRTQTCAPHLLLRLCHSRVDLSPLQHVPGLCNTTCDGALARVTCTLDADTPCTPYARGAGCGRRASCSTSLL
jgi:hypothetical protein